MKYECKAEKCRFGEVNIAVTTESDVLSTFVNCEAKHNSEYYLKILEGMLFYGKSVPQKVKGDICDVFITPFSVSIYDKKAIEPNDSTAIVGTYELYKIINSLASPKTKN